MSQIKEFSDYISSCFSKTTLHQMAVKSGLIKRRRLFTLYHLLWLCVWQDDNIGSSSLVDMCHALNKQFGLKITPEGLNQRFNQESVSFLKAVFTSLFEKQFPKQTALKNHYASHFNRIRILDSTSFQIPNVFRNTYPGTGGSGKKSALKIQLEYDLLSGEFIHINTCPGKIHDAKFLEIVSANIERKDLCIRDLGYFKLENFSLLHSKEAYFLSRLKVNTTIYTREKKKSGRYSYHLVDLSQYLLSLPSGSVTEIPEIFIGRSKSFPSRLIIYRLTKKQLTERRIKQKMIAQTIGSPYTNKTVKLSEFNLFITNVPLEKLPMNSIFDVYSLRWQIELLFKSWKSYFLIHQTKSSKIERFECQLYGKLIAILLSTSLMFQMRKRLYEQKQAELSELKSLRIIYSFISQIGIYSCIKADLVKLEEIITAIFSAIEWLGTKCRRYEKSTALDILLTVCK